MKVSTKIIFGFATLLAIAVAALVYQHRQHYINVFVWPSAGASDSSARALVRQGYNLINWTNSGMNYWATSDLNLAELQEFVQLLQK